MRLCAYRLQRFAASASPILFTGAVALFGLAVASLGKEIPLNPIFACAALGGTVLLLIFQIKAEYQRRTYDPLCMFRLEDDFRKMKIMRSTAARVLRDNQEQLNSSDFRSSEIDDVLDFFEGMAFLVKGGQLSPEIAHHAFHYWIHGYYLAAKRYLDAARHNRPAQWEFIRELYELTSQVEQKRTKNSAQPFADKEESVIDFLDSEIKSTANN